MADEKSSRPYRMQRRAELQERTRLRITESAAELHGTLGPSQTSISAVAAHAGVRRSTVYRHFPDEAALFDACTSHWAAANPLPNLDVWAAVASPEERLRLGLRELYAFYHRADRMLDNLFRDESTVPIVEERFAAIRGYFANAQDTLMRGRKLRGAARRRTQAATGHAINYFTWRSLVREQGLSEADAAALMEGLVVSAGGGPQHEP
jgi:AcrR family transcriptional regulator